VSKTAKKKYREHKVTEKDKEGNEEAIAMPPLLESGQYDLSKYSAIRTGEFQFEFCVEATIAKLLMTGIPNIDPETLVGGASTMLGRTSTSRVVNAAEKYSGRVDGTVFVNERITIDGLEVFVTNRQAVDLAKDLHPDEVYSENEDTDTDMEYNNIGGDLEEVYNEEELRDSKKHKFAFSWG
jgi:hypothetical protein